MEANIFFFKIIKTASINFLELSVVPVCERASVYLGQNAFGACKNNHQLLVFQKDSFV